VSLPRHADLADGGLTPHGRLLLLHVEVCLHFGSDRDACMIHVLAARGDSLAAPLEELARAAHVPHEAHQIPRSDLAVPVKVQDLLVRRVPPEVRAHVPELRGVQLSGLVCVEAAESLGGQRLLVPHSRDEPAQAALSAAELPCLGHLPASPEQILQRVRLNRVASPQVGVLPQQPAQLRLEARLHPHVARRARAVP